MTRLARRPALRSLLAAVRGALPLAAGLLCACSGAASAQTRLGRTSTHPRGIDGAISRRQVEVDVDEDGLAKLREQTTWEVLTDYALDNVCDPTLVHDVARQRLEVARARTVMTDGTVVDTPPAGINARTPGALALAPAYATVRETIVSLVGVDPGSTLELDYAIADTKRSSWSHGGVVALAGTMPAKQVAVRVRSRSGTLRSACVRCALAPNVSTAAGESVHAYEASDLVALDTHEIAPHFGEARGATTFVPRIVYGTGADWGEESRALAERVRVAAQVTEVIRRRAERIVRDEPGLLARVEALQGFVAGGVDTVAFDLPWLGYEPATAERVLGRSYGSEVDKGVLLIALLAAVGVDAHMVLVSEDSQIAPQVAWLGQLDHASVVATIEGEEIWMPVDEPLLLARSAIAGDRWALDLSRPGPPLRLEPSEPAASTVLLVADVRVAGDLSLSGSLRLDRTGRANPYSRLRAAGGDPTSSLGDAASSLAAGATTRDASVTRLALDGTSVRSRLDGTLEADSGQPIVAIAVPWPPEDPLASIPIRSTRATPLVLPGPLVRSSRVSITIPQGWRPVALPCNRAVEGSTGWLRQHVTVSGSRIEISREVGLRLRVVEPGDYPGVRSILATAGRMRDEPLLLEPGDLPAPQDLRIPTCEAD